MTSRTPQAQNYPDHQSELSAVLTAFKEELLPKVIDAFAVSDTLETIQKWAGTNLFLTRLLCHYVLVHSSQFSAENAVTLVDLIVEKTILDHWKTNSAAVHLMRIQDALLNHKQRNTLLTLYAQILQEDLILANHNSLEQSALLQLGLVVLENDSLRVTNAIYANIFDLGWIEQQAPGLIRNAIARPSLSEMIRPSSSSRLYSKLTVFGCGIAVLVAAMSAHFSQLEDRSTLNANASSVEPIVSEPAVVEPAVVEPAVVEPAVVEPAVVEPAGSSPIISTPPTINHIWSEPLLPADKISPNVTNAIAVTKIPVAASVTERDLFDRGMEHAASGRWLPMLREFCMIPEGSVYFVTAERQLERWTALYPDDIHAAEKTLLVEGVSICPIEEALTKLEGLNSETLEAELLNSSVFSDAFESYQSAATE